MVHNVNHSHRPLYIVYAHQGKHEGEPRVPEEMTVHARTATASMGDICLVIRTVPADCAPMPYCHWWKCHTINMMHLPSVAARRAPPPLLQMTPPQRLLLPP